MVVLIRSKQCPAYAYLTPLESILNRNKHDNMMKFSSLVLACAGTMWLSGPAMAQQVKAPRAANARVNTHNAGHAAGHGLKVARSWRSATLLAPHQLPAGVVKHDADQHTAYDPSRGAAPANDNCAAAITLVMGSSCNPTTGTVDQATQSIAAVNCNSFTGNANDDVWYKFVATATSATIDLVCNASFDGVIDLRSGACNGTNIACGDDFIAGGSESIAATGLTVGATYYVRVYDYEAGYPTDPTFDICVYGTPPPPVNDDCSGATVQNLSAAGDVAVINGTNAGATDGEGIGFNTVWEAFSIDGCANVTVDYCGTSGFLTELFQLTQGCPFTSVIDSTSVSDCGDGNLLITFDQLAAGTYYVPVYQGPDANGPYTMTITTSPCGGGTTPPNDECVDAVIQDLSVPGSVTVNGDNTGATDSEGIGFNTVWEAFSITECADVTIDYCGTTPAFGQYFINLVDDCNFTTIYDTTSTSSCLDGNVTLAFTSLPAGTYHFPVLQSALATGPYTLTFTAVACGGGNTPPNDDCANATIQDLSVPGSASVSGDNTGATDTEGLGTPTVWEAFTITECANVTIDYCGTAPAFGNAFLNLFIGCPFSDFIPDASFDVTTCPDGNVSIFYTGVPAGTYYYAVLTEAGSEGPYTINFTTTPCAAPPANDDCGGAIMLDVNLSCEPTQGDVTGATQSIPALSCNGFTGNANDDVWYSFIATSPNATITVDGTDTLDAVIELLEGVCGSLSSLDCADATFGGGVEEITTNSLMPGNTYYVRVYDWYGGYPIAPTFDICIVGDVGTGIDATTGTTFNLRPNPTDGNVALTIPSGARNATIELYDMTGRQVYTDAVLASAGRTIELPLAGRLAAGTYTVRLITEAGRSEQRLMVR